MKDNLSPHLRDVLGESEAESNGAEQESGLPSQAEGTYQAYGQPVSKPLVSVHFITPDGCVRSFQYRHLDSDTRFEHRQITLRFLGYQPIQVVIEGQHLRQLYDQLHRNVTPWIMQAARDFPEKNKPFVGKLTFIDLTERER
jgi:hypothetical protein